MTSETPLRHYLPAALGNRAIKIVLVGCGGNGAQMLMGLASLDTALRAISSRSLDVTVVDDDIVSEANLGRQPFFRCEIGNSKARTLPERINLAPVSYTHLDVYKRQALSPSPFSLSLIHI